MLFTGNESCYNGDNNGYGNEYVRKQSQNRGSVVSRISYSSQEIEMATFKVSEETVIAQR